MPKAPEPKCELCHGTGRMEPQFVKIMRSPDDTCLCTVSGDELTEGLKAICRDIADKP